MSEYFSKLNRIIREKNIIDDDVWNMNETSFRIDCERAQLMIILDTQKSLRITNSDNRDYIIFVECINFDDEMISSLIILIEMHILHKWCEKNDLNEETLIEISETNYSNDDLIMNWLHHFIHHTRSRRNEVWLLFIIDEFDSHSIISFLKLITINNIILFRLSIHLIHLTQSLNVRIFQSYKHYHVETVNIVVRMSDSKFDKLKFLAAFQSFRSQIFKSFTIRHAFRITDIVSFNLDVMLDIIRQKQVIRSRISSSDIESRFNDRTSRELDSIRKYETKLQRALINIELNERIMIKKMIDDFQRFLINTMMTVDTLNLITRDLEVMQRIITSRKARASLEDQMAAKSEVIKISQCRKLCSIRKKKEKEKLKRKEERDAKKASKISLIQLNNIRFLLDQGLLV